jgi:hypothetical protein
MRGRDSGTPPRDTDIPRSLDRPGSDLVQQPGGDVTHRLRFESIAKSSIQPAENCAAVLSSDSSIYSIHNASASEVVQTPTSMPPTSASGRQATASSTTLVSAWLQELSGRASECPQSEHGSTCQLDENKCMSRWTPSASAPAASRTAHAVDDPPDYILNSHHRSAVRGRHSTTTTPPPAHEFPLTMQRDAEIERLDPGCRRGHRQAHLIAGGALRQDDEQLLRALQRVRLLSCTSQRAGHQGPRRQASVKGHGCVTANRDIPAPADGERGKRVGFRCRCGGLRASADWSRPTARHLALSRWRHRGKSGCCGLHHPP